MVTEKANLQAKAELVKYLQKIQGCDGSYTLIGCGYKDFIAGFSDLELSEARQLGMFKNISIDDALRKSYIVVIKDGKNIYEGVSNRTLVYNYSDDVIGKVKITSNGVSWKNDIHIICDDVEQCVGGDGINFVLYDNHTKKIIDSVYFNTCKKEDRYPTVHINQVDNLNAYLWELYKCIPF